MMSGDQNAALTTNIFKWNWRRRESSLQTGLLDDAPLEIELSDYQRLPSPGSESPSGLLHGEGFKIDPIADLDIFFERVYNYYCEKGLWCIIVKWIAELLSLGFTICFSGFFLLFVDWNGLRNAKCGIDAVESGTKPCDLAKEALHSHPLTPFSFSRGIIVGYLGIFTIYWLFCFLRFFAQLKDTLEIRNFYYNCLNITDREVQTAAWPEVLEKVVQVQHTQKLCVIKNLSAHDVIMRIMRKENYLIGMVNKGIIAFPISRWIPGAGPAVNTRASGKKSYSILTKTLEWTLNWCILQSMFDRNYCIRRDFISNPSSLRKRLMVVGLVMLLLSPFLVIFMLVYLFLRHAEQFYNHPSTASSRRWSNLSRWMFREFNEVDHLFKHRINNSVVHASDYLRQFPSPIISLIAKFISFVSGGFAAILIIIAFLDESLLEGHIFGRNLFWYAAVFGTVTAISRAAVADDLQVLDPEGAMSLVVQHTHYMPKRWRGKENTDMVRVDFETLFQYTGMMLLEEMASIFLTPFLLLFVVPKHVDDILQFISNFTVDVEGVGDVCSFSTFDFEKHGNTKYGSPYNSSRECRSSQGKMEKSFLSFQDSYPSWEPDSMGGQFLRTMRDFRERQTSQVTVANAPSFTLKPNVHGVQIDMIHRFPSREVQYSPGGLPRPSYNFGSLWSKNHEQKNHPYLLDWYYDAQPLPGSDLKDPSKLTSKMPAKATGDPWPRYEPDHSVIDIRENWNFHPPIRSNSHLGASTSGPFFRENIFRHHGSVQPEEPTDSHWWTRAGPHIPGTEASFLEPPMFGHLNSEHHSDNASDRGADGEDNNRLDMKESHRLSKTTYMGDYVNEDTAFDLPFNDIYAGPSKSLPFGVDSHTSNP